MVKSKNKEAFGHEEIRQSITTSHVELRHDGGTIRLSFFRVIMSFMLLLTMLMIASGIAVSAATTWLVGLVLILPGLLLLCITALVASWILSRHRSSGRSPNDEQFASVAYSRLPLQRATTATPTEEGLADADFDAARKPKQQDSRRPQANVS
ncbi:uncharacterized protein LOC144155871 [Haemaphysalis longicornis]